MSLLSLPTRRLRRALTTALASGLAIALGASAGGAAASIAAPGFAAPSPDDVREALHLRLPKTRIDSLDCDGFGGLCEVVSKNTLFYIDARARFLMVGRLYDMETRQDLTAARLLALNPDLLAAGGLRREARDTDAASTAARKAGAPAKVTLDGLTPDGAIVWGPEGGPRAVVFSDFHCGYCKRLTVELQKIGARVEERPISIFGPEARKQAERVLCSPSPEAALHAAYSGLALANPRPCDTRGLDANEAFAKRQGFSGTPVIVRPSDGAVIEGYRNAAGLRAFLASPPATSTNPKG